MESFNAQTPKLPIEIEEGINGDMIPEVFQAASEKLKMYEEIQNKLGLKDRDIELLADSENPYRLKGFSKDEKLRIKEIKEQMAKAES